MLSLFKKEKRKLQTYANPSYSAINIIERKQWKR